MARLNSESLVHRLESDTSSDDSINEAVQPTIDALERLDLHAWVLESPLPHAQSRSAEFRRHSTFLAVLVGECQLKSSRGLWDVTVTAGDMLIVREATSSLVHFETPSDRDDIDSELTERASAVVGRINPEKREAQREVLSLGFAAKSEESAALVSSLPPIMHVAGNHGSFSPWAACFVQLLIAESACPHMGSQSVLDRLVSALVLKATLLQMHDGTREPVPAATLLDEEIEHVMTRMQRSLDLPWTLESLADEVGISRSAFAVRFKNVTGQSPMAYLRSTRMNAASNLLRRSRSGLKEIALRTGYKTPSAFAIAFKRWAGVSPGEYRSSHHT